MCTQVSSSDAQANVAHICGCDLKFDVLKHGSNYPEHLGTTIAGVDINSLVSKQCDWS